MMTMPRITAEERFPRCYSARYDSLPPPRHWFIYLPIEYREFARQLLSRPLIIFAPVLEIAWHTPRADE